MLHNVNKGLCLTSIVTAMIGSGCRGNDPEANQASLQQHGQDAASKVEPADTSMRAQVCPVPAAAANERIVFDDSFQNGWQGTSWGGPTTSINYNQKCSDQSAFTLFNVTDKYTGLVLYTSQPVAGSRISARVFVDQASVFSFGIGFEGQAPGAHTFISAPGGGDAFRSLTAGWQLVEGIVPESFEGRPVGPLTRIIFELQNDTKLATFSIDDLRITLK